MTKSITRLLSLSFLAISVAGCYTSPSPRDPIATKYVHQRSHHINAENIVLSDAEYNNMIQAFATDLKNNKVFQKNYQNLVKELDGNLPVVIFNPIEYNFKTDINALDNLRDQIKTRFLNMGIFDVKELSTYGGADIQKAIVNYMAKSVDGALDKQDAMTWFGEHRGPEYFFNSYISKQIEPDGSCIVKLKADLYCLTPKSDRAGLLDWTFVYTLR